MSGSLETIAPGVYAWLDDAPRHGHPNAGVVIAEDGITVIDALTTPRQAQPLADSIAGLTETPIRRLVLTGSHIDFVGGAGAFPLAAVYGSSQTSDHLDQPGDPHVWTALHPEHAADFVELTTRTVSHTVVQPAHLCPASIAVPVSGFQFENLAVQVPGVDVVFLGALARFGTTPLGFDADFANWIDTLRTVRSWGQIFVPGHGSVGGIEQVDELIAYLEACCDAGGERDRLAAGPWSSWIDAGFHEINVQRAAMLQSGDQSPPPALLRLVGMV